jgi:hypothetical protein
VDITRLHKAIFIVIAAFVLTGSQNGAVFAADEQAPAEQKELKFTEKMAAILFSKPDEAFVYKRENRNDPFVPFVQERVVATEAPLEVLTGMRKFAMVQDSNNQGYIIREGVLLGRTGVVEAIMPNKVIVKNYTYNLAGDKIYKTVEMVLRQEGEK